MSQLNFVLNLAGPISPEFVPPFPTQRCQVSDEEVTFVVQVLDSTGTPINLTLSSSNRIITVRPNGVSIETQASYFTNGLDGKMQFNSSSIVPAGTGLDEGGVWQIQGRIVLSGHPQFTDIGTFSVGDNLGA